MHQGHIMHDLALPQLPQILQHFDVCTCSIMSLWQSLAAIKVTRRDCLLLL